MKWTDGRLSIAIIGGGAAAVCLLDALAQASDLRGRVVVVEPSRKLWRGRPYQEDIHSVRVNIPPKGMSVRHGDTNHFSRWLADRSRNTLSDAIAEYDDPYCGVPFVPRTVYGEYLQQCAWEAITALRRRGLEVEIVRDTVETILRDDHRTMLWTRGGLTVDVDHAVLCIGRGAPPDNYRLDGAMGFVRDPYPLTTSLESIDPSADLAILGSGLTAMDVVLALAARDHRGRIRLLSRHGVLPAVRQRPVSYALQHFTADRFRAAAADGVSLTTKELVALMRAELIDAGEEPDAVAETVCTLQETDPVDRLRRELAAVDSKSIGLRILQQAVPETGPDVWPLITAREKTLLLRRYYRTAMSLCCPMPPSTAGTLLSLIDSGQLEVVSGVRSVKASGKGFAVEAGSRTYQAHAVVNAVNSSVSDIPSTAEPLVASLVGARLAQRHAHGGLAVERATSRLVHNREAVPGLFALGDLASGSLFFTFGLPSLVDRAHDIAEHITQGFHSRFQTKQPHFLQRI
ncbi:FAD/NAD(P)-binding protein [Lipingzhangella sp. LS1_29]|uniref:FAD/NAD(P)-binding protein n=1 Tax=Lipingzhangella rawalii TaxID=2055835 RepID=A0ABU2HC74_9ACTN|nr:FAD/NAD(P)-binding protein [Lipingzhangella rawalii]MDS1272597.1 FAD/NAD(P)-binding protein [Lipingzhangella rawalii]